LKDLKDKLGVYLVTDRRWLDGRQLCGCVESALESGVDFVQLREKGISREIYKEDAIKIKKICERFDVPFVINDDVWSAVEFDADGVHIGQGDEEIRKAREILGEKKIIGVSVSNLEEALKAEKEGADYLGVGAVFATGSKNDTKAVKLEDLEIICDSVDIPVVAIGGIDKGNAAAVKATGASGIAAISGILACKDVGEAARELCDSWKAESRK